MLEDNKTSKTVWEVLDSIHFSFNVDECAERVDIELLRILNEGINEGDINKIYDFIETAERGNQPIINSEVPQILEDAYKTDARRLFRFIESKKDIVDYWTFLSLISDKHIIYSFANMESDNSYFFFECARQILTRFSNDDSYKSPCTSAIIKFAMNDLNLWNCWTKKFENNVKYNRIIWNVISKLESPQLLEYSRTIRLIECFNNETGRIHQEGFLKLGAKERDRIILTIAKTIYDQWESALIESKNTGKYQNNILFSKYYSVILSSMELLFSEDNIWAAEMEKYVQFLESDIENWFSSETKHFSVFFLNLTNIYYLLLVKENKLEVIDSNRVKTSFEKIEFLLTKYECYWLFEDASEYISRIKNYLTY